MNRKRPFRAGYSFTEVMFAVVVLGIGFIMIAAMFPVAISQQQSTQQETNAAAIARAAASFFESTVVSADIPATGSAGALQNRPLVYSIRNPQSGTPAPTALPATLPTLWDKLKGSLIDAGDSRYGVAMFYRRSGNNLDVATWAGQAQLIIIVTQVRSRSAYEAKDVFQSPTEPAIYNLQGRPVKFRLTSDGAGAVVDQIVTVTPSNSVAEGSYVVVSDDNLAGVNEGYMNGRIFRIGAKVEGTTDQWELMPGNDFKAEDPDGTGTAPIINGLDDADAFVIGRDISTPGAFEGGAQDVAAYVTFVQVR